MPEVLPDGAIRVLDHGFVRLDDAMADDLSVVNSARVSFGRRVTEVSEADAGLIRFLMRDRHGCYDDATEVLTADGWKAWPSVTGNEVFATRTRDGRLEHQPALRLVRKEFRGHMIGFKGMSIDLMVTPDHRVLAEQTTTREARQNPTFTLRPAHSVLWRPHRHVATAEWTGPLPVWFVFDGMKIPAAPFLRLLGFFIGDGNLGASNHLAFNLRKEREIRFLERTVRDARLELKRWRHCYAVPVTPEMREVFAACYDEQREKIIPRKFLRFHPASLRALYSGLLESDGSRLERPGRAERQTYSTTSRPLADSVQELALKMGRSATVRPHHTREGDGHYGRKPRWRVTIYSDRNTRPALCRTREQADEHMGVENYDGLIHCVEVPNHTLYVRRNGYAVWSGNTPFEHNSFRFHVRCPLFVAREWFRHRIGCLTGDTLVTFVSSNGHASRQASKTMADLWRMWHVGELDGHALSESDRNDIDQLRAEGLSTREISRRVGRGRRAINRHLSGATTGHRSARSRLRRMKLRVLNEETREFEVGHIADVVAKGPQPVYRLTLADGKDLTLTENHQVLTSDGWKTMREAVGLVGEREDACMTMRCALFTNGQPAHQNYDWLRARRSEGKSVAEMADAAGCSYHTIRKRLALHSHRQIHRTVESELAFALEYRPETRPRPATPRSITGWKLTARAVDVVGIAYVGVRETYDLCIEGPWHNFVANGVVVHNSFNEFSMRYARATDDFYVPEAEDVRTQVGKPGAYSFDPVDPELAETTREELRAVYETAYATYERLVEQGVARELARAVLPVGAYTEFYWTVNARALMNFVSLRAADTAQREIRRYADAVERFLAEKMPITYEAFVANGRVAP